MSILITDRQTNRQRDIETRRSQYLAPGVSEVKY